MLAHWPYLHTLPPPNKLLTSLHFTETELDALGGSNLYGATIDRQREWQEEWKRCQAAAAASDAAWEGEFTWERYLTAATYLSSRAFPSTLLSETPSLVSTPSSHPVLLPGVDALNHARGQPVSWLVTSAPSPEQKEPAISLVIHYPAPPGSELFNNYGPKPNAELILGYGFTLPDNPDDTIVLKIGSAGPPTHGRATQTRFEVGRDAHGMGPVWDAILELVAENEEPDVEDRMFAAEMLGGMAADLARRLPSLPQATPGRMRTEVAEMITHYLQGQRDILRSIIAFSDQEAAEAEKVAREQGLDLVDEAEEAVEEPDQI